MLQSLQLLWGPGEGDRDRGRSVGEGERVGLVASGEGLGDARSVRRAEGDIEVGERVVRGEECRSRGLEWAEEAGEMLAGEERQEGDKGRDAGERQEGDKGRDRGTVHCVLISL